MTRRIAAYILIVLGFLTCLFLEDYTGRVIPNTSLIAIIGLVVLIVGYYLLRSKRTKENVKETEDILIQIENLKLNGERIRVEFSKCEIKTNDYTEERERYSDYRIQAWNTLGGDGDKNVEQVEVYQSRIIFHHEINGKTETFVTGIIQKEPTTLLFLLDEKKETTLYVDKNDRNNFYFDLEFLTS